MKITLALAAGTMALSMVACSSWQHRNSGGSSSSSTTPTNVNVAASQNASQVLEIAFDKDSAELTEAARQSLNNVINAAQSSGKIEDVKVIAWADADYPSVQQKKLDRHERDLADRRATAVRDYVKANSNAGKIDTFNMAQRPNGLQRLFNSKDARLKAALENAGIPNNDSVNQTRVSKASHALVMMITQ